MQRHVGTEEVVVGHEQSSQNCCAVHAVKTGGGTHVVFESSVQSLNKLFESSPLLGFGVKILQADNLLVPDRRAIIEGIQEMDAGGIGGIAVGNENEILVRRCRTDSFLHGNNGRQSTPVVREVIGGDFEAFRGNEEEDVVMLAEDLDVGFIAC